ncbi:hypothetical protein FHETE_5202 [Fusarium heterosporum]|uniref:BZIP domain-containing protein n=1 Tax=Fusarium heterosporum TaxID=42747 RepID=A0A8H5TCI4_FUSHE|nr:hypothetical protein FHETE_5202 [Fusarium heterosporum]
MAENGGDFPTDVEAGKQRRRLQNRKNQRARRQRIKGKDTETYRELPPFEIKRWRIDETDSISCQDADTNLTTLAPTLPSNTRYDAFTQPPSPGKHTQVTMSQTLALSFPLSSDHLIHLIHQNVFRGFITIKRILNTISLDSTTCPVFGPLLDDTTRYPPKSDIPPSLAPTALQLSRYHFPWINIIPFAPIRDNLIRREGRFDSWELWRDLVGDLMTPTAAAWQRGIPSSFSASVSEVEHSPTFLSESYTDMDEVTAGSKGLILWGDPHDWQNWEATPGFLTKWSWAVQGCEELVMISNRWREKRGEEPMTICRY